MVSSTPTPPEPPAPAPPGPRHEALDTIAAQIAAIDLVIGLAQRSIRVFDISLSDTGWNGMARAERIAAFLRTRRSARLDIVVQDTGWIERWCPRLTNQLKYYSHALAIFRAGADAARAIDPFVIVDDRHYLHRFHFMEPRATLGIEQPLEAARLADRFATILEGAEPGVTATTLGL